ncbi:hypothetical protein [Oricola indica]|uniref:hypothetical protein n=1 Tax=Oricola indica TaxID=2872591 RepID=UPI003CCBEF2B
MSTEADITFRDNEDFGWAFQFTDRNDNPYDFTGSTFKMDVRTAADAGSAEAALTTANGGIVSTDLAAGTIEIVIAKGALDPGEYVYDLVRVNGGAEEVLLYGAVTVIDGVTA